MPITPPLDEIPKATGQVANVLIQQLDKLLDLIFSKLNKTIQDAKILPDDCNCDDPRIQDILDQLNDIQNLISRLQQLIPIITAIITGVKTAVTVAQAIKAAQLLNPVTAPVILATESVLIQNLTIQAGISALDQLNIIPDLLNRSINQMNSKLGTIVNRVGQACPNDSFLVSNELQDSINSTSQILSDDVIYNNPNGIGWGTAESRAEDGTLGTEFYSKLNVSNPDLEQYNNLINEIISEQRDLLTSIQEAPAQSYNGRGAPDTTLGKSGDYYIDTANQKIYGPKTSNGWPRPVNY